jgi:mono/diheme cytochrome c family protein
MTNSRIIGGVIAALLIGGTIAVFAIAWRPAVAEIEPPAPQSFDTALVKRGRDLAAIGNCNDCHTVRGGKNFAGGLPVATPFGTIYSTNITPDAETGIGRWSEAAFRRAMREGIARNGQHLYRRTAAGSQTPSRGSAGGVQITLGQAITEQPDRRIDLCRQLCGMP